MDFGQKVLGIDSFTIEFQQIGLLFDVQLVLKPAIIHVSVVDLSFTPSGMKPIVGLKKAHKG